MFYSHEVLTSRKYGVATVWLVATLGSKSHLKKVSRKAILDVDVAKTCETIITPEAPMALRLQSNLLYGVTRVYAQQCGYVLTDAENARNNMRAIFKVLRAKELDVEGGHKARADQLMLQDDPNFLPELDLLPLDLDNLDLTTNHDSMRSTLSPHSSQLTIAPLEDIGGIVIPGSASSFLGGPVGGLGGMSIRGDSGGGSRLGSGMFQQQDHGGLLEDDLGLVIGDDGNVFIEDDMPHRQPKAPAARAERLDFTSGSVGAAAPGEHADSQQVQTLFGQPIDGDGFMMMPEDEIFPGMDDAAARLRAEPEQHSTTSETADAPMRRHRRVPMKVLTLDNKTELRSSEINGWSQNYLMNMTEALRHKQAGKLAALAKKNAEHWMLGTTLGQADRGPLNMFTGIKLLEAIAGIKLTSTGVKRAREDNPGSEDSRRVRSRGEPSSDEQGRGLAFQDDGYMPMMEEDIEHGREQPTPLDDRQLSSIFPWNQSEGSRRPTAMFGTGRKSSVLPGLLSRRGSRLTSASPLVGRGADQGLDDYHLPDYEGGQDLVMGDDFEMFGPAAQVDTQLAAESQWVRTALDSESANFLTFVQAGIEELDLERDTATAGDEEDDSLRGSIDFEYLLPTESNTRVVAAQALLHVLTLGTKNALRVEQPEAFGPITMRMILV